MHERSIGPWQPRPRGPPKLGPHDPTTTPATSNCPPRATPRRFACPPLFIPVGAWKFKGPCMKSGPLPNRKGNVKTPLLDWGLKQPLTWWIVHRSEGRRSRQRSQNEAFEDGFPQLFSFHYQFNAMITQLVQVSHNLSAAQLRVEQLAVKEEPRATHEPRNWRSTSIVDQKSGFYSFHYQSRQLNATGANLR